MEVESTSPDETESIAARVAASLQPDDVVTISGELGTGKTTFVRGACRALGVEGPVTSPTYTIGHRYKGKVDVSHLDLYRFDGVSPAEWGDLEPYFEGAVCFVEWPEAGVDALPRARFAVRLDHAGRRSRRITVTGC
jgi:tRNA threonylcarbamoyladenosine biosynthesis protein TsaE